MPIFCTANIQSRQQKLGKRKLGGKPSGIFCRLGSVNISLRVQHTSTFASQLYPSYFLIYLRSSYSCEASKGLENPTETAENDPIKKQVTTRGPIRSQRSWPRVSLSVTKTNAAGSFRTCSIVIVKRLSIFGNPSVTKVNCETPSYLIRGMYSTF